MSAGRSPAAIVAGVNGRIYVADMASNSVSVVDTETGGDIADIPVGTAPAGLALSPDGRQLFVANFFSGTVAVIDTGSNSIAATWHVGFGPSAIAAASGRVYLSNGLTGQLDIYDTGGGLLKTLGGFACPISMAANAALIYVANGCDRSVAILSASSFDRLSTISLGAIPSAVALNPDGSTLYVASLASHAVFVIGMIAHAPGSSAHRVSRTVPATARTTEIVARSVPQTVSVKSFGAAGNAHSYADGYLSGTLPAPVLHAPLSAPFRSGDVGKLVEIQNSCLNAGSVSTLEGRIAGVESPSAAVLSVDTASAAHGIACAALNAYPFYGTLTAAVNRGATSLVIALYTPNAVPVTLPATPFRMRFTDASPETLTVSAVTRLSATAVLLSVNSTAGAHAAYVSVLGASGNQSAAWAYGTEDESAIQAAVNHACAITNATVYFPSNTGGYMIRMPSKTGAPHILSIGCAHITLQGDNPTWIYSAGAWSLVSNQVVRGASIQIGTAGDGIFYDGVSIQGLGLEGMTSGNTDYGWSGAASTAMGDGWDTTHQAINAASGGAPLTSTGKITIQNCTIQNYKGEEIIVNGNYHNGLSVLNNVLLNSEGDHISTSDLAFTATGNTMNGAGNANIENGVYGFQSYEHIDNNRMSNGERGAVILASVSDVTATGPIVIQGNTMTGCGITQAGGHFSSLNSCVDVTYQAGATGTLSVQMTGNSLRDFTSGVSLGANNNTVISGNTFVIDMFRLSAAALAQGIGQSGIRLDGGGGPNTICVNCVIENNIFEVSSAAAAAGYSYAPIVSYEGCPNGTAQWMNVAVAGNTASTGRGWTFAPYLNLSTSWALIQQQYPKWADNTCAGCAFTNSAGLENLSASAPTIYPAADIVGISPNANLTATLATAHVQDGHQLKITNVSATYTVTFVSDIHSSFPGTVRLAPHQTLSVEFSGALRKWVYQSP